MYFSAIDLNTPVYNSTKTDPAIDSSLQSSSKINQTKYRASTRALNPSLAYRLADEGPQALTVCVGSPIFCTAGCNTLSAAEACERAVLVHRPVPTVPLFLFRRFPLAMRPDFCFITGSRHPAEAFLVLAQAPQGVHPGHLYRRRPDVSRARALRRRRQRRRCR